MLTGVAAAAAGLMLATVLRPLFKNRAVAGPAIALASLRSASCIGRWLWFCSPLCRRAPRLPGAAHEMRQRHAPDSCGIFRADLAVRDRRRQIRDSGNPPLRRRCAALVVRPAVRRFLCAGATHAGPEPDHRHADRLSRRRRCRGDRGDAGDVRAALRDCLSGRPHRRALQGRGLAWRDQPRPYWVAGVVTLTTAVTAFSMRLHPLWAFAVAALLGAVGVI